MKNDISILVLYQNKVPDSVLIDVYHRITDWLVSGGNIKDEYITNQLDYVKSVYNKISNKKL